MDEQPKALFEIQGSQRLLLKGAAFLSGHGQCFVCGKQESLMAMIWVGYVLSETGIIQEIFKSANAHVVDSSDAVRVFACNEHKLNLVSLCRLVFANDHLVTASIVQEAMRGEDVARTSLRDAITQLRGEGGDIGHRATVLNLLVVNLVWTNRQQPTLIDAVHWLRKLADEAAKLATRLEELHAAATTKEQGAG